MNRRILHCGMAIASAGGACAQSYTLRPIDTDPGIVSSAAAGITADGRVFGEKSVEGGRRTFGFIWRAGVLEQLVVPQAGSAARPRALAIQHHVAVLAMTPAGTYAGVGSNVNLGFSSQPYFSWIPTSDPYPSEFYAADNVGNAAVYGVAEGSPYGVAVGAAITTSGSNTRHGFISLISRADDVGSPPRVTVIPGLGGAGVSSAALAVNASGDVVGYASTSAGIHRPVLIPALTGVAVDLGGLGGPSGEARAISDGGFIAGQADVAAGQPHAFFRVPGGTQLTDLGTLGGATSAAYGVNSNGAVVGESWTDIGVVHAFVYRDGVMTDLNSLIPPGSGWVLTHASGINDAGQISGWGLSGGRIQAFALDPAAACYANCDNSTIQPILNINDFTCFLNRYAAGDSYANCDGSTVPPILNVNDFTCFLNSYAVGCP